MKVFPASTTTTSLALENANRSAASRTVLPSRIRAALMLIMSRIFMAARSPSEGDG
jgi:hypothetical protein